MAGRGARFEQVPPSQLGDPHGIRQERPRAAPGLRNARGRRRLPSLAEMCHRECAEDPKVLGIFWSRFLDFGDFLVMFQDFFSDLGDFWRFWECWDGT